MSFTVTGVPEQRDEWADHRGWESEGDSPVPSREVDSQRDGRSGGKRVRSDGSTTATRGRSRERVSSESNRRML